MAPCALEAGKGRRGCLSYLPGWGIAGVEKLLFASFRARCAITSRSSPPFSSTPVFLFLQGCAAKSSGFIIDLAPCVFNTKFETFEIGFFRVPNRAARTARVQQTIPMHPRRPWRARLASGDHNQPEG